VAYTVRAPLKSVDQSLQFDLCLCEQFELRPKFGVQRRLPRVSLQDDSERVMLLIAVAIPAVGSRNEINYSIDEAMV
jgi:hypothetical protein